MTKKKESINNEEVIELGEKEKLTEILYQLDLWNDCNMILLLK